jgi:hypothetical protein
VYRPPVHANTQRDIGFKRSSDEWAQTPRQDSSSGNPALLIGSGSYGCPILQRFRICTACSVCSCPLQLSHPGRLITQEYLFNSSCLQQGYHNSPHGAHRTYEFPGIRLSSFWELPGSALRISRPLPFHSHTTCCPSPCLKHYPEHSSTMATPSPPASRLVGDPACALMRRPSTGRCLVRFLQPPHWWSLTVESVPSAAISQRYDGDAARALLRRAWACTVGN